MNGPSKASEYYWENFSVGLGNFFNVANPRQLPNKVGIPSIYEWFYDGYTYHVKYYNVLPEVKRTLL